MNYSRHILGCFCLVVACFWSWSAMSAVVTADKAGHAAQGWLRMNPRPFGQAMSATVKNVETIKDANGAALYHIVHFDPVGYVVLPAEDTLEPIVAFSATGRLNSSSRDPMVGVLGKDLSDRIKRARAGGMGASGKSAQGKWNGLLAASGNPPPDSEMNGVIVLPAQVWVAPFMQTLWSQTTDVSLQYAVYNYYTPPYSAGNIGNYYCGCVATCLAQLMYYFQWPTVGVGTASFPITNNGTATMASLRGGNGSGGPYNWSSMTLSPNQPATATAQAIGDLCYDSAVASEMDFEPGGSSAYNYIAYKALTNTFKFASVGYYEYDPTGLGGSNMLAMINPNIDARLPVSLGITGLDGGHCVAVDGYGYNGTTIFHHLNCGWAGDDDLWYQLPSINTSDNGVYTNVFSCTYNIFTNGSGVIISGRVTDPTGAPIVGASIVATRTGGGTYNATTDTNGIYAFRQVPASSQYTIAVSDSGYATVSSNYSTGATNYDSVSSGNVWGANFVLSPPLLAIPETGFSSIGPVGGPFSVTAQTFVLTNTSASTVQWALGSNVTWLTLSSSSGSLGADASTSLTVSLNSTIAGGLAAGSYPATVWVTNVSSNRVQSLAFSLSVKAADYPIAVSGFNADVVVENSAIGGNAPLYAQQFDPASAFFTNGPQPVAFYQAGLTASNEFGGAATKGLPTSGSFVSDVDNATTFQFAPYTTNNVLYLTSATNSGTLNFSAPMACQSLSILAASAQGGGSGSLVIHFANGSSSSPIAFSALNYFQTNHAAAGAAWTNFGILYFAGDLNQFYTVDYNGEFPALFQTSINLTSLGLQTNPISSVTFTMPSGSGTTSSTVTGIFAVSGTQSQFPAVSLQPQGVTIGVGTNASFGVSASGGMPLIYQWYLNGSKVAGAQSSSLNITSAVATNAGSYQVVVTNNAGAVTSSVALLTITNVPVQFLTNTLQFANGKMTMQVTNLTGQGQVVIDASTNLLQWVPVFTNPSGFGGFTFTDAMANLYSNRFYKALVP